MELGSLVKIRCSEEGYHPLIYFEGWRVAFLNDTKKFHAENIKEMQRHNTSDEVFLLLEGSCTLYIAGRIDGELGRLEETVMEKGILYNVPKGVWHTHITGPGAKVAVIENADVSPENTDYCPVDLLKYLREKDDAGF